MGQLAVGIANVEAVKELIATKEGEELSKIVNQRGYYNKTPLMDSFMNFNSDNKKYEEIINILLSNKADVNLKADSGISEWAAIHIAANEGYTKLIKLLMKYEADIELKDNEGKT